MTQSEYIPGVCNIGKAEITRRRNVGWVGLAVTAVAWVVLVLIDAGPWWRLLVFFPATASASGFLQAHFGFCSAFSRAGVFNFGAVGSTHKVGDEDARAKDRRRGNQITLYAAIIGAGIALIATFV